MSTKYSKYNSELHTNIPMLQRDYVQGAARNAKKRDPFVVAILNALAGIPGADGKKPNGKIDFIYGSTAIDGGFLPIDGQQRLTTLALIGWMLYQKHPEADYKLPRMAYRTRHTTEQFVNNLMGYRLPADYGNLKDHLISTPLWMAQRWLTDPSVAAMLDLLVFVDTLLESAIYKPHTADMAWKFFNDSPIEFEMLDMKKYNLTEDLYIKMNARGKHLTPFENWKAEFTGMLEDNYAGINYTYTKVKADETSLPAEYSIPDYFSYAIEHDWTDLLWPDARNRWERLTEEERKKHIYPRVDEAFMNLLDFVSRGIFYSSKPEGNAKYDSSQRMDLYRNNQKNVETLFNTLDALSVLFKQITPAEVFKSLIYSGDWQPDNVKINIFGKEEDINLFDRCINANLTEPLHMLLRAIINYHIRYRDKFNLDSLRKYLRVVRGWILSIDQRLGDGKLQVVSDIGTDHFLAFERVTDVLLKSSDVYESLAILRLDNSTALTATKKHLERELKIQEYRQKGATDVINRLMGCHLLKGNLACLYPALDTPGITPSQIFDRFLKFNNMTDWEKARVLIGHGWKGENNKKHQGNPFYGKEEHWDYILSTDDQLFRDAFTAYLSGETPTVPSVFKKEYYIYTYKSFLDTGRGDDISHLFNVVNDFEISRLGSKYTYWPLHYRYCPYATAVCKELEKYNPAAFKNLDIKNVEGDGCHGYLEFHAYTDEDGSTHRRYWMESKLEGWHFRFDDFANPAQRDEKSARWHSAWGARFTLDASGLWHDKEGYYHFSLAKNGDNILLDHPGVDRVQNAVQFLAELYRLSLLPPIYPSKQRTRRLQQHPHIKRFRRRKRQG